MTVAVEDLREVHVVRLSNGPANILSVSAGVVAALRSALTRAQTAPDCRGVVIAGTRDIFCGGADLGDLGRADDLRSLFDDIECSAIPVVMAISGAALGGGLEMALAGHCRIAARAARFALPEVGLGLLPGLGGTQRLPRLIGAEPALDLMLSGQQMTAEDALAAGLIDAIADSDVVAAAILLVRSGQARLRRTSMLAPPSDVTSAVAARRRTHQPGLNLAPERILDCVASMSGNMAEGLRLEAELLDELVKSEASRGLRHAFFAHRAAMHVPGLEKGRRVAPPASARIVGRCAYSQTVAASMRAAGVTVSNGNHLRETDKPDLIVIVEEAAGAEAREPLEAATITVSPRRAAGPHGCGEQGAVTRVQFKCADSKALMEIIRTPDVAPAALAAMVALGKAMGKTVTISGDRGGSIFERLAEAYAAPVRSLLAQGLSAERIDRALTRWGMAQGPVAAGIVYGGALDVPVGGLYKPGDPSDEQIVEFCLLHVVNEGAHLIEDEVAWRAADIDVTALEGLGFARERGGPMFQADCIGLPRVLSCLQSLYAEGRMVRKPASLIEALARDNATFARHDSMTVHKPAQGVAQGCM